MEAGILCGSDTKYCSLSESKCMGFAWGLHGGLCQDCMGIAWECERMCMDAWACIVILRGKTAGYELFLKGQSRIFF